MQRGVPVKQDVCCDPDNPALDIFCPIQKKYFALKVEVLLQVSSVTLIIWKARLLVQMINLNVCNMLN